MKNRELFEKTVGILTRAYINGTLQSTNCCACAVGNMIADAQGFTFVDEDFAGRGFLGWKEVNTNATADWLRVLSYDNSGCEDIDVGTGWLRSTGYDEDQLRAIERAFEDNTEMFQEDTYDGLVAVYNLLLEIHEANAESELQASEVFVKPAKVCELVVA